MQINSLFRLKGTEEALKNKVITDRPTDLVNFRVACTRLKRE